MQDKAIRVDDIRIRGIGKSFDTLPESVHAEHRRLSFKKAESTIANSPIRSVYFEGHGRLDTPIVKLRELKTGDKVDGPALLIDETQTLLVEPKCSADICSEAVLLDIMY